MLPDAGYREFPVRHSLVLLYKYFCASLPRLGRTIVIRDAAFVTYVSSLEKHRSLLTFRRFRAVLEYLYTREFEFETPNRAGARSDYSSGAPIPSAKSIYRLADKVCYNFLLRVRDR